MMDRRRARWYEWLGRFLSTLLAMMVTWAVTILLGLVWYLPSVVDDWHSQVVVRSYITFAVATVLSIVAGIELWRRYPAFLNLWGIRFGAQ